MWARHASPLRIGGLENPPSVKFQMIIQSVVYFRESKKGVKRKNVNIVIWFRFTEFQVKLDQSDVNIFAFDPFLRNRI